LTLWNQSYRQCSLWVIIAFHKKMIILSFGLITKFSFFMQTGLPLDRSNNLIQRIHSGKRYLKADYKLHVIEESPCSDHCINFALSSNEKHYKSECKHDHNMICDRCNDCKDVCKDVLSELDSNDISYRYS
jgi:hypothetical protein